MKIKGMKTELWIISICVFLVMLNSVMLFPKKVNTFFLNMIESELDNSTQRNTNLIYGKINDTNTLLYEISTDIINEKNIRSEEIEKLVKTVGENFNFRAIGIVDTEGKIISKIEFAKNGSDENFYKNLKFENGEEKNTNWNVYKNNVYSKIPIFDEEKYIGVLFCIFNFKEMFKNLDDIERTDTIYVYVIDSKGGILIRSVNSEVLFKDNNYYEWIKKSQNNGEKIVDNIQDFFKNNKIENMGYSINLLDRVIYFAPLNINDWYIVSMISKNGLSSNINQIKRFTNIHLGVIILSIAYFLSIIIHFMKKNRQVIEDQNKKLQISEKTLMTAAEETSLIIYDYDIKNRKISFRNGEKIISSLPKVIENVPESLFESEILLEECKEETEAKFASIAAGAKSTTSIFCLKNKETNEKEWFRSTLSNIFNDKGEIEHTIGMMVDITKERKKELLFKNKSKKDSLTNLYNRESAVKIIEGILKDSQYKESIHALMIMDFDNFKTINDSLGHIMGDKVLIDAAAKLRKALRKSDIIARLGGDEILIFLLDIGNKENVARVASQIVAKMRDSYEKDEKKVETSVSIGIAISPTDGRKFTELYEKADIAMYEVKKSGRNGYHIYLE